MHDTDALFVLQPRKTVLFLTAIALVLVGAGLAMTVYRYGLGYTDLRWFWEYFDLGREANLPTYFSSGLLLIASLLLAWIARVKRRREAAFDRHWLVLALIFFYLSVDEAARLHEFVYEVLSHFQVHGSGIFYHVWVVPFLAAAALVGLAYLRFLFHLPAKQRFLFVAAALLYVGGAIGFEMFQGVVMEAQGRDNLTYHLSIVVEEAMEMGGVLVFIYALLHYIGTYLTDVRVRVAAAPERVAEPLAERLRSTAPNSAPGAAAQRPSSRSPLAVGGP